MSFYNKLKWVLGIVLIFVLIVTTNLIDRNSFIRVRDSLVTLYEDRLVADDLIFEMSRSVQEKAIGLALEDTLFYNQRNAQINQEIEEFIISFELTSMTDEESRVFAELKTNFQDLKKAEGDLVSTGFTTKNEVAGLISGVKESLYKLSKIQLNEGRYQIGISKRAIDTVELFTKIEIYILVFLAIVIQIIIIYNPKPKT